MAAPYRKRRRLYFDLESSPNIGFFWQSGYKLQVGYENIIKERAIICICYKWEGEKDVYYLTWDKKQCDKAMLKKFVRIAEQADEIIAHNGDRFDIKWLRTRCIFHRIPALPNYTSIDTLKVAKSGFKFNSNRLDYIGQFLGVGQKMETGGFDLWKNIVLNKCEDSLNKMVKYCQQDVKLLEKVFNVMNPYIKAKTHQGVLQGSGVHSCPECGSEDTYVKDRRSTAAGSVNLVIKCKDCGKHHTVNESRYVKSKAHSKL